MIVQIGVRLEEERKRLGLTQDQMAALGEVAKRTYCNYEAGAREPGAGMLLSLSKFGIDIQYIITGERKGLGIGESSVYRAVLDAIDLLSLQKKVDATQLANAVVKLLQKADVTKQENSKVDANPPPKKIKIEGGVSSGQIAQGDITNQGAVQVFNQPVKNVAGRDVVNIKNKREK